MSIKYAKDMLDVKKLYGYIESFANENGLCQTAIALPYALEKHRGQVRKGKDKLPYIVHPLHMARHAISIGITDDDILSAALLHDVAEDCSTPACELPVNERVQRIVALVTFCIMEGETKGQAKARYFEGIGEDEAALTVKLLDRCNNISFMVDAFTKERMREYIAETRQMLLPLAQKLPENSPAYALVYHIAAVMDAIWSFIG